MSCCGCKAAPECCQSPSVGEQKHYLEVKRVVVLFDLKFPLFLFFQCFYHVFQSDEKQRSLHFQSVMFPNSSWLGAVVYVNSGKT